MPRKVSISYKLKCLELCCGKIIRDDKWNAHCRVCHGFKSQRGDAIKHKTVEYKEAGGKWQRYLTQQVAQPSGLTGPHPTDAIAPIATVKVEEEDTEINASKQFLPLNEVQSKNNILIYIYHSNLENIICQPQVACVS